tara:strand:+ start:34 stop:621 length:588 start_codon:yes stop_codon:yes gene_type:complete
MKSFHQFYEQAVAAAPAPAPAAPKPAAKAQSKAKPKVTDPSTGVDIDDKGRWQGDIVDQGKELEPEQKIKIKDGRKGPDPNLPSGEANPNKKKDDEIASADWPKGRPGQPPIQAPWNKGWPTVPGGRPFTPSPGDIPGTKYPLAKNGKGTQIAAGGNPRNTGGTSSGDPNNIQWPRNKYPNKKAPPGPGYRPPTA